LYSKQVPKTIMQIIHFKLSPPAKPIIHFQVMGKLYSSMENKRPFRADGSPLWRGPRKGNLYRSMENKKPFRADGSPLWRGPRKGNLYRSMENKKPFRADGSPLWRWPRKGNLYRSMEKQEVVPGGWLAAMEKAA